MSGPTGFLFRWFTRGTCPKCHAGPGRFCLAETNRWTGKKSFGICFPRLSLPMEGPV